MRMWKFFAFLELILPRRILVGLCLPVDLWPGTWFACAQPAWCKMGALWRYRMEKIPCWVACYISKKGLLWCRWMRLANPVFLQRAKSLRPALLARSPAGYTEFCQRNLSRKGARGCDNWKSYGKAAAWLLHPGAHGICCKVGRTRQALCLRSENERTCRPCPAGYELPSSRAGSRFQTGCGPVSPYMGGLSMAKKNFITVSESGVVVEVAGKDRR